MNLKMRVTMVTHRECLDCKVMNVGLDGDVTLQSGKTYKATLTFRGVPGEGDSVQLGALCVGSIIEVPG